jgi:hypothetical protein
MYYFRKALIQAFHDSVILVKEKMQDPTVRAIIGTVQLSNQILATSMRLI